jgi:hypothetical protein
MLMWYGFNLVQADNRGLTFDWETRLLVIFTWSKMRSLALPFLLIQLCFLILVSSLPIFFHSLIKRLFLIFLMRFIIRLILLLNKGIACHKQALVKILGVSFHKMCIFHHICQADFLLIYSFGLFFGILII